MAMAAAQVIDPGSKLAIARGLRDATAASSLGEVLGAGCCDEDDLYEAMDWLAARQQTIEDALAARHLAGGTLVLYDVSSAAFEGRTCPLGAIGHPEDGVRGRLQIVYGLLTSPEGIPVAIEVFAGNTGDPKTVASQVTKVKDRFGITKVVLVGDRGMLTAARLREDVRPGGLDWITALRAPQVKKLVRDGDLQLTLFDVQDLAEITSPDFPGERLVACMNPFLEAERARKRESLLAATEADLATIAAACARARRPLRGQDTIAVRVDRVLNRRKVGKHFTIAITDDSFSYARNQDSVTAEAKLDGIYVLRTSVRRRTWTARKWSPPTRPWPRSSGPSARSIPTWTSGRSGTGPRNSRAHVFLRCSRTTSPGTCRRLAPSVHDETRGQAQQRRRALRLKPSRWADRPRSPTSPAGSPATMPGCRRADQPLSSAKW